ncbi:adenylate/guanylate cyclase domain-containing protein [Primorskyibacter sp. S87]|uniref:adenylate/guanylate cyclase domain-containing protein n=1 Tax=Primorskyibacter sp. S87 TaxID=3415126 RepID=UPI003C7E6264
MAGRLWQGNWVTRTRIGSGLFLFVYAFFHFTNIGLGLLSPDWMEAMQDGRQVFTRSKVGTTLLYLALVLHSGLALWRLALRRTLRMRFTEALQIILGLLIPLQLLTHLVFTRFSNAVFGVNDEMSYVILIMWGSAALWQQVALLLVVWTHGCIGLHFWLRLTQWWQNWIPYLIGVAVLVPAFALAGLLVEGRRISAAFQDEAAQAAYMEIYNWPSGDTISALFETRTLALVTFLSLLGLVAAAYFGRKLLRRRRSVRIRYIDGPEVTSEQGMTLLDISRTNGVPHTALCGGKGRCTTCRVIVEQGAELLHPPDKIEQRSLEAAKAPPNARLACQIRPNSPMTVFRIFRPEGGRSRAHASQGQERRLAVLFLDMRGFTARTTGQLPYDVVFLLNRFFDAIVPSIIGSGGVVDKYLGDGLLAIFETADEKSSARAAMQAAIGIGGALRTFNQTLKAEGAPEVRIGIGLHLGNLVLGEIGAAGHAPRTIIGDTVNAASRLEAETKTLGVELLVSQPLLEVAGVETRNLDLTVLTLRGVDRPLPALAVDQALNLPGMAPLADKTI